MSGDWTEDYMRWKAEFFTPSRAEKDQKEPAGIFWTNCPTLVLYGTRVASKHVTDLLLDALICHNEPA